LSFKSYEIKHCFYLLAEHAFVVVLVADSLAVDAESRIDAHQ